MREDERARRREEGMTHELQSIVAAQRP
jgi:hypothetical protein